MTETMETEVIKDPIAVKELNEIWPDLSNELAKLQINISEYGYNNLYSRYFVNKLERFYMEISKATASHLLGLFILQFKGIPHAYRGLTVIKCIILLRQKFRPDEVFERLRDMLTKKIDDYKKFYEAQAIHKENTIRYRGLITLLHKTRIELSNF